jgi:hypothetical protein
LILGRDQNEEQRKVNGGFHPLQFEDAMLPPILTFMYYNFARIHKTLRVTPAMAAGLTDRLWDVADIVDLVDAAKVAPKRPAAYRKRAA